MHYAVQVSDKEKIGLLASYGNIDVKMDQLGWTSLHYATYYGHIDSLAYLCELGANPNETDIIGCTPMHIAYIYLRKGEKGHFHNDIVSCLQSHNADKNATDVLGLKPSNYHWVENRNIRHDVIDFDLYNFLNRETWKHFSF